MAQSTIGTNTPPDATHESSHRRGGQAQEAGAWCFAAAVQTVLQGFGATVSQAEIAHNSLIALGLANDNPPNAT